MKSNYFVIFILVLFSTMSVNAQFLGGFDYGNDGHIYFSASNNSGYTYMVKVIAISSDRTNSETRTISSGSGFYIGPTTPWKWYWKHGDELHIVYANGQSQYWVCPENDPAYSTSNVSFGARQGNGTPPNSSSDGYIYQGRSVKLGNIYYKLYRKDGHYYVYDKGEGWIKVNL